MSAEPDIYSPRELELIGWLKDTFKPEQLSMLTASEPPPDEPEPPKVPTTVVERFTPRHIVAAEWLWRQFSLGGTGRTDISGRALWMPRRFMLWLLRIPPRAYRFQSVAFSGKICDDRIDERDAICDACEFLKYARNGHRYCGSCGCPNWRLSRLEFKNSREANHCPQRKHPGEYVQLITAKWPNRRQQKPRGGCGGSRNG